MSTTALICQGLTERVEKLEEKERLEEERAKREKEERRFGRTLRTMKPIGGESKLAPRPLGEEATEDPEDNDRESPIYEEHAARIFRVLDRPYEKSIALGEAIVAIRRRAPLTIPDGPRGDEQIKHRLERRIVAMMDAAEDKPPPLEEAPSEPQEGALERIVSTVIETFKENRRQEEGSESEDELVGKNVAVSKVKRI